MNLWEIFTYDSKNRNATTTLPSSKSKYSMHCHSYRSNWADKMQKIPMHTHTHLLSDVLPKIDTVLWQAWMIIILFPCCCSPFSSSNGFDDIQKLTESNLFSHVNHLHNSQECFTFMHDICRNHWSDHRPPTPAYSTVSLSSPVAIVSYLKSPEISLLSFISQLISDDIQ